MRISDWSSDVCSSDLLTAIISLVEKTFQCLDPIRLGRRLVPPDPMNTGEAHRDAGFMAGRALHRIERDLQHEARFDGAHRPAALDGMVADIAVRSEEHKAEIQALMRPSYAGFCLK